MKRLLAFLIFMFSSISSYAYQYGAVTATGSATLVVSASRGRAGLMVCNNDSTNSIYLGLDASVTSSNGIPILAGTCYSASAPQEVWKGVVYVITAGSSVDTRYQEYGLGDLQ